MNAGKRQGEVWVGQLQVGSTFRLDLDRGVQRTGTVVGQGLNCTVRWDASSKLEAALGEEFAGGVTAISGRTAVVKLS